MNDSSALALIHPAQPAAAAFIAVTFTAVILIPVGFLCGLLWEKMAAKISSANTTAPRTSLIAVSPVRPASNQRRNPESVGA